MWFNPEEQAVVNAAEEKRKRDLAAVTGSTLPRAGEGWGGSKLPKSPHETSPESIQEENLMDPSRVNEEDYRKMYQSGIQQRTDAAIRNAAMQRGMGRSGYAQAAVNRSREAGTEAMGQASTRAMLDAASERSRRYGIGKGMRTAREDREQAARIAEDERRKLAAEEAEARNSFWSFLE